jgi:hypothetical protein
MHQRLFRLPPPQDQLPRAPLRLWQRLPIPQRQPCHARIAQLFVAVVHSQSGKESRHARHD